MKKPGRGTGLLLEHVFSTEPPTRPSRPAFERLCASIGSDLAGMLVSALAVGHGSNSRRRDLVA